MKRYTARTMRATAAVLTIALALAVMPIGPSVAVAARTPVVATKAVVAVHVSEYTSALHSTPGVAAPPNDVMGWYHAGFTYSMVYTMLEESLKADGTPFVRVTDAQIESGALLTDGVPTYPIVFSMMSEAASDAGLSALSAYATAGGSVYVGGSSFTRRPNGTFRTRVDGTVQSGLSAQMGVESVSLEPAPQGATWSWGTANTIRRTSNDPLVAHLTADADLAWPLPNRYDSDTALLVSVDEGKHPVWTTRPTTVDPATVLVSIPALTDYTTVTGSPWLASKQFGAGRFIFQSEVAPLAGWGGLVSDTYAYLFVRRAVEAAFAEAGVPVVRVSAWRYPYHAALQTRWDCDFYPGAIANLAAIEKTYGVAGQYYINTALVNDAGAWVQTLAAGGSIIGSHSDSHTGLDPVDVTAGAANVHASLDLLEGWLGTRTTNWVAPSYQAILDRSFGVLVDQGLETAGEQGFGPFPHYTLSMTNPGQHYDLVQLPTSEWLPSSASSADARARMEEIPETQMAGLVDFYYDLGALINVYGHPFFSNQARLTAYLTRARQKADVWFTNAGDIRDWWVLRDQVSVTPATTKVGDRIQTVVSVTGASDPDTAIDILPPGLEAASLPDVQVTLDGVPTDGWRVSGDFLKVRVGTASTVVVSWPADAVDTTPPSAPTAVSADHTLVGATVLVTWTDPTARDFSHVHVYRSTTAGSLGVRVTEYASGEQFIDTGLENGTTYHYTLRAVDTTGNESADSAQVAATPQAPAGGTDTALDFDGVDDVATVPYAANLNVPGALTVEAWVNADTLKPQATIVGREDGAQQSWSLYYQNDGRVLFYVRTPNNEGYVQATTEMGALVSGAWRHVAGVLDPAAQQLRVYVDGVLKASEPFTYGSSNSSTARFFVNGGHSGSAYTGIGDVKVDEVRLSGSVRYSGNLIAPAIKHASDADTIGLWHFDDAAGTVVVDAAHGNNGAFQGAPQWVLRGPAYTVTPSAGAGGSTIPGAALLVPGGSNRVVGITPNTGYHIEDVLVDFVSVGAVSSYTFTNVSADRTIAASFGINQYTLSSSAGAGGAISGSQVVDHGSNSAAFAITPIIGYHIEDVLVDGVSVGAVTSYTFENVTANGIIAAQFAPDPFTITPTTRPGGTISPSTVQNVVYGDSRTFTFAPDPGYHIVGVSLDQAPGYATGRTSVGAVSSYEFANITSDKTIVALFAPDRRAGSTRYEQTDGRVGYAGTWTRMTKYYHSEGSYDCTELPGGSIVIRFRGTAIDWVTNRDRIYGIASVSLDGGAPVDVDLYATANEPQSVVWSASGLPNFEHVVRIQWTGRANAASPRSFIGIDAVDIVGELLPANATVTASAGSGGSISPSGAQRVILGDDKTFTITPDATYLVSEVVVDGNSVGPVSSYTFRSIASDHTITASFVKDPVTRFEQTDTRISYTGTWTTLQRTFHSEGSYAYINKASGKATVRFHGSAIDYITAKDTIYGIAKVTLDDHAPVDVDLYSSVRNVGQVPVWSASDLEDADHTLTIEWTGRKNAASGGYYVGLDAFGVVGTIVEPTTRLEQTDTRISYTGTWTTLQRTFHSEGSYAYTNKAGGKATVRFHGSAIDYITAKDTIYGIAKVTLDDHAPVDVDLYSSVRNVGQVPVWSASDLEDADHTLTIEWTGRKNSASGGYYVGLDALGVVGEMLAP